MRNSSQKEDFEGSKGRRERQNKVIVVGMMKMFEDVRAKKK